MAAPMHDFYLLATPNHLGASSGGWFTNKVQELFRDLEGMATLCYELQNEPCEAIQSAIQEKHTLGSKTVDWDRVKDMHEKGYCAGAGYCIRKSSPDASEAKVSFHHEGMTSVSWRASGDSSVECLTTWLNEAGAEFVRIAHGVSAESVVFDLLESMQGDIRVNADRER